MPRVIAYDLFRLSIGPIFYTPRGIDRVDLALARHVFDDDASPNLGILPTPWGVRAFPARIVRRWLSNLQELWAEDLDFRHDRQLRALIEQLHPSPGISGASKSVQAAAPPQTLSVGRKLKRVRRYFRSTGFPLGQSARQAVPAKSVYLNIGQLGLAVPFFHSWLNQRADITCAMMLHDAIPLEFPHLVPAGAEAHHARMIRIAARHAHCLIFNSAFSEASVHKAMDRLAGTKLPGIVRTLPLPTAFTEASESLPELADVNYFIVVSTIEPRKNHALLIRIWQRIIDRLGAQAPHLIIVGSRGFNAGRILAPLDSHPALRNHVHIVSGLSSPALAALVLGASAMLCPSFTEGFGLPVLEAGAMGVATIASDIPAHREVGSDATVFLPCDAEFAWEEAILAAAPVMQRSRPIIANHLTEAKYCADIINFVQQI